jgi:hypothetical protein
LSKVKEIKRLCGGVVYYAAQARAQIDAEIGQKDHLWIETRELASLAPDLKNDENVGDNWSPTFGVVKQPGGRCSFLPCAIVGYHLSKT